MLGRVSTFASSSLSHLLGLEQNIGTVRPSNGGGHGV
jgi:hypothetical protein